MKKFEFRGQPLTKEQTKFFVDVAMAAHIYKEIPFQEDADLMSSSIVQIIEKRISVFELDVKISNLMLIMLLEIYIKGNPGKAMSALWILFNFYKGTMLTFNDFGKVIFPWGCPTHEEFETWWESQKGENGRNEVDFKEKWVKL